jgi:excinuclease ABC subunit C
MKKPENIPSLPGVYFFKDKQGIIIYIGKAVSLKSRIANYFQPNPADFKIVNLLKEAQEVDYIITTTESEALLLEANLIFKNQPKFNVIFKDGQPFVYLLFTTGLTPGLEVVRNKKKKGAYFGPFIQKSKARSVFNFLIRTFQLFICNKKIPNGCLDYHLGICSGSCKSNFDMPGYLFRLHLAQQALKNDHDEFMKNIDMKIKEYNAELAFEKAKRLHEYKSNFQEIVHIIQTHFSENKFKDELFAITHPYPAVTDDYSQLARELQTLIKSLTPIRTIDCFDISHFQGHTIVGSCVRFTDGKPEKNMFRRFKIKSLNEQNDYAALQEITQRRYRNDAFPDLILIDGGKGQLNAVQKVVPHAQCISLAKREETVYSTTNPEGIKLDLHTDAGRLLIALRDYAHHFAISYHRLRRKKTLNEEI